MKSKRVVVYVPEEDHDRVKPILRGKGLTLSGWFRRKLRELCNKSTQLGDKE